MTELVTARGPVVAQRFDGFRHAVSDTFVPRPRAFARSLRWCSRASEPAVTEGCLAQTGLRRCPFRTSARSAHVLEPVALARGD
jgi:hypothetical protein